MTPLIRVSPVFAFFAFVACGGATAIVPDDDGSGATSGNGGATGSGSFTGAGGKPTGGFTGAGGKVTGGVTGAGGKPTGGVTGAGGRPMGGVTGAGGGKATGGVTGAGGKATGGVTSMRWAKEYEQSCNYDGDCYPVTEGPVCTCNACFNAAINQKEAERWINATGPCGPIPCDPIGCEEMLPACYGGICGVRRVEYIQPEEFDRNCAAQSDCYLVLAGDLCSQCNCQFGAVSLKGLEQYKARVANGTSCGSPGPDGVCDCAVPQAVCSFNGMQSQCAAVY